MRFTVRASLALWRRRLAYRQGRALYWHRRFNDARARKWTLLARQAGAMVDKRTAQLRPHGVSRRGVALIKSFEGFRGSPYQDAVGVWTIGYGHTEGVSRSTRPIFKWQATRLLRQDLNRKYCPPVLALGVPLNQNQVDALTSLVYNLGPGILAPSHTIGAALRQRNFKAAADAFLLYDHAGSQRLPGLTRRRQAERALFLKS